MFITNFENIPKFFGSIKELSQTIAIVSPAVGRENNARYRAAESKLGREFHSTTWKVLKTSNDKRGKGYRMYVPLKGQVAQLLCDMVRSSRVGLIIRNGQSVYDNQHTHLHVWNRLPSLRKTKVFPFLLSPPSTVLWVASIWSVRYGMPKYALMRSALPCHYCSKQSESQDLSNESRPPVRGYLQILLRREFADAVMPLAALCNYRHMSCYNEAFHIRALSQWIFPVVCRWGRRGAARWKIPGRVFGGVCGGMV